MINLLSVLGSWAAHYRFYNDGLFKSMLYLLAAAQHLSIGRITDEILIIEQ